MSIYIKRFLTLRKSMYKPIIAIYNIYIIYTYIHNNHRLIVGSKYPQIQITRAYCLLSRGKYLNFTLIYLLIPKTWGSERVTVSCPKTEIQHKKAENCKISEIRPKIGTEVARIFDLKSLFMKAKKQ